MKLNITIAKNGSDQPVLDGFCKITQYDSNSGISQSGWLAEKVIEWVYQQSIAGKNLTDTAGERAVFTSALSAAMVNSRNTISAIPIEGTATVDIDIAP